MKQLDSQGWGRTRTQGGGVTATGELPEEEKASAEMRGKGNTWRV